MNSLKIAILIRGFHYITKDTSRHHRHRTSPQHFDYREVLFSFIKNIYEPLLPHLIDLYLTTYHSPIEDSLRFLPNVKLIHFNENDSNQFLTLKNGLQKISTDYDLYIITRFDLFHKVPLQLPTLQEQPTFYPVFKETLQAGNAGGIGDCFMIFNQNGQKILLEYFNEIQHSPKNLHLINHHLIKKGICVLPLFEGHFDSNTSFDSRPDCKNPFYIMWGRPYHHKDIPPKP